MLKKNNVINRRLIESVAGYSVAIVATSSLLYNLYQMSTNYYLNDKPLLFPRIVNVICSRILGSGFNAISEQHDGGRDGSFNGTTDSYPSRTSPITGKIIIQCKHFRESGTTFSSSRFNSAIKREMSKIKTMIEEKDLDYYFIFSNASKSHVGEKKVKELISRESKIQKDNIHTFGRQYIETFLDQNPNIVESFDLLPYQDPIDVNPEKLTEIIVALKDSLSQSFNLISNGGKDSIEERMAYTNTDMKNKINKLSDDYYQEWKSECEPYFQDVDSFFKKPQSTDLHKEYMDVVSVVKFQLISKIEKYSDFSELLQKLFSTINENDVLKKDPRVVRLLFYFAYVRCDIGKKC